MGAFECHPNLLRYKGRDGSPSTSPLSQDVEDSKPPNVAYAIDRKNPQHHMGYTDSENDEIDSDTNDYDSSDFYYRQKQKELEAFNEVYDWEYLEPSLKELRIFEEEQMRAQLAVNSDSKTSQHHLQVANEMDVHRDRLRRLDYGSTYLDYAAMSSRSQTSSITSSGKTTQSSLTEPSRISSPEGYCVPEGSTADDSGGFLGTLSSLWTSAFGGRS